MGTYIHIQAYRVGHAYIQALQPSVVRMTSTCYCSAQIRQQTGKQQINRSQTRLPPTHFCPLKSNQGRRQGEKAISIEAVRESPLAEAHCKPEPCADCCGYPQTSTLSSLKRDTRDAHRDRDHERYPRSTSSCTAYGEPTPTRRLPLSSGRQLLTIIEA